MKPGDLIFVPIPCGRPGCEWPHTSLELPKTLRQAMFLGHDSDGFMRVLLNGTVLLHSEDSHMRVGCNAKVWEKKGIRHRDGDKPAIIFANGSKFWYRDGLLHRDGDKPAVVYLDGQKEWWTFGSFIREEH